MKRTINKILTALKPFRIKLSALLQKFFAKLYFQLNNEKNILYIWIIKNKKYIFVLTFLITLLFFSYVLGYVEKEKETDKILNEKEKIKIELKSTKEEKEKLNEQLKNVYSSKEYLMYKIYKSSGIRVPHNVPQDHLQTMYDEAVKNKIPIRIFFRVVYSESEFKSKATSKQGAKGYMQLMPDTYNIYSHKLKLNKTPSSNIKVGAHYLKDLYCFWDKRVKGEHRKWGLALASYNAGIDRVLRDEQIPDNGTTRKYVRFILD